MTFSTNQVRHLYVVKGTQASVGTADTAGKLAVKADSAKSHLYFEYKSPGGLVRSDLIDIKNIIAAKATDATSLRRELGQVKVALDSAVNSGAPVAGQDYLLRVAIRQFAGMSDEDQYFKHGLVRATAGMTAEQFYTKLKDSLVMNFSREASKLFDFTLDGAKATKALTDNPGVTVTAKKVGTAGNAITIEITDVAAAATAVTVTGSAISVALAATADTIGGLKAAIAASAEAAALVTVTGTDATAVAVEAPAVQLAGGTTTGVVITEVEQDWKLGVLAQVPVYFSVHPTTILVGGVDEVWGVATPQHSGVFVGNGKNIADLEYFCMGERGDQYRNIGWPHVFETTYLVDPATEYSVLDIHYAYVGSNEGVQKSERDITLVGSKADINTVIGAINAAADTSIATLA